MTTPSVSTRPYWHVDAKWVCGIIFSLCLIVIILLYTATTITRRSTAVPVATQTLIAFFSREGQDDSQTIRDLRRQMAEQGSDSFEPFPGQPVSITKNDLDTLTVPQLKEKIFGQLAAQYYDKGVNQIASQQTSNAEEQAKIEKQAGLLKFISQSTHDRLQSILSIVIGISIIPLIGLIYFSYGVGRLVSPGLILFLIPLPITLVTATIAASMGRGSGPSGAIPFLPQEATALLVKSLLPGYALICITGFILLILASIIGLWLRHAHKE